MSKSSSSTDRDEEIAQQQSTAPGPDDKNLSMPPSPEDLVVTSRRKFLNRLSIGLGVGTAIIATAPVAVYIVAPLFKPSPEEWRDIKPVNDFKIGETVQITFDDVSSLSWTGIAAKTGAWLRRNADQDFTAFAVNCTHLGCPVTWSPTATLFICPCHGGVYYKDGSVAAGPPPKALATYKTRVQNGVLQVLTGSVPITLLTDDLNRNSRPDNSKPNNR